MRSRTASYLRWEYLVAPLPGIWMARVMEDGQDHHPVVLEPEVDLIRKAVQAGDPYALLDNGELGRSLGYAIEHPLTVGSEAAAKSRPPRLLPEERFVGLA